MIGEFGQNDWKLGLFDDASIIFFITDSMYFGFVDPGMADPTTYVKTWTQFLLGM